LCEIALGAADNIEMRERTAFGREGHMT
jgi:hypothetical protein